MMLDSLRKSEVNEWIQGVFPIAGLMNGAPAIVRSCKVAAPISRTIRCFHRLVMAVSLMVVFAAGARAETQQDEGLWLMVAGQGGLGAVSQDLRDVRWWLDVQPRFANAAGGLGQALVRPGLGYAFSDRSAGWLGYAWILTERRRGGHSQEHRIWQQLTWSPEIKRFSLASRTRLEQRFLDTGDDVGWRFRQFVKGMIPLAPTSRFYLTAYDEVFVDLNDTDWGQSLGISQNRLFLGVGWKFQLPPRTGPLSVELGYLNQFVNNPSGADRINHIGSVNLFLNY